MTETAESRASSDLRTKREEIVLQHVNAENGHNADGVVSTFRARHARYDIAAFPDPVDGGPEVADFMNNMFRAFPDWHVEPMGPLVHCDTGVFLEVRMTGTQNDEWIGIPAASGRMDVRLALMYDFEEEELVSERVWFDMATVMSQLAPASA